MAPRVVDSSPAREAAASRTPTEQAPAAPIKPVFPPDYTGPGDEQVLEIYLSNARAIESTTNAAKNQGRELNRVERDSLAWKKAVNQMIQEQRFYYLGPQETRRAHRNTDRLRYIITYRGGLLMIWELSKAEFPDAFESWPR